MLVRGEMARRTLQKLASTAVLDSVQKWVLLTIAHSTETKTGFHLLQLRSYATAFAAAISQGSMSSCSRNGESRISFRVTTEHATHARACWLPKIELPFFVRNGAWLRLQVLCVGSDDVLIC